MLSDNTGFTLVELLLGVAVLSVLLTAAVPHFQETLSDTRQVNLYNEMSGILRFARSESIKRSEPVTVCARASDSSCGSNWSSGMLVFVDSASDGTILVHDGADTTIRSVSLPASDIQVSARALLGNSTAATTVQAIRFNGRGQPNWLSGTLLLCDGRGASHARALIMTGSGIARKAYRTADSNDVVVDALGTAVSCVL